MASTSLSIHGARKINIKSEVIVSSVDHEKYAYMRMRFEDGNSSEVSEITAFRCNVITIEDADNLDVFFVKNADGKTRLEISIPNSSLDVQDVERTDAKTLKAQEQ